MTQTMQDPKATLLDIIKSNLKVTKDDGTTQAKIDVCYAFPEEELPKRLDDNDIIVTLARESEIVVPLGMATTQKKYVATYNICISTKDKTGASGEKLRFKATTFLKELWREIEIHHPGVELSRIKKVNERDGDRVGSPTLFQTTQKIEVTYYGG